jgi:hypothetical protein
LEGLAAPRGSLSHEGRFGRRRGSRSMIYGTCRTIVSNSALGIFDNPISSELTQPRANIAGRYTQALGNFLCREAVGRAPQDLEDAILKFRHHISPNLGRFSKATNLLLLPLKALHQPWCPKADQISRVRSAASARPKTRIDQSPVSKPRSRRMSAHRYSVSSVADKWRPRCCARATIDDKENRSRLRFENFLWLIRQLKIWGKIEAGITRRYSELLHLYRDAEWCSSRHGFGK